MTQEQKLKIKKQEYNKRYYQKLSVRKKQDNFIKAAKLVESCWNIIIPREDVIAQIKREKTLHKMIVILSIFVIILSLLILFPINKC